MRPTSLLPKILAILPMIFITCQSQSQYDKFLETYDLLTTVAGIGNIDGKSDNGWLQEYEGGPAIEAELSRPHMAMADAAGNIYIADKDAHAIRKVDLQGLISTIAGTSIAGNGNDGKATEQALNAPNGLWVKKDGTVYILDLNNDKIRKVDTQGNMTTVVEVTTGISLGRGLWVSKNEDTIWVASGSRIKMWTEDSLFSDYATGFSGLGNIMQEPAGNIVATDRSANRVYRIAIDGTKEVIAGNGTATGGGDGSPALETGFHGVRGVWFLEDGTYFLATHEGSQIWHIDGDGIAHLFLDGLEGDRNHFGDGENFRTPGYKISEARAVSVDYQGNVLITENDRGFIRKIQKKDVNYLLNRGTNNPLKLLVYPNPFVNRTNIKYEVSSPSLISIEVFSSSGKLLKTIQNKFHEVGTYTINWQTNNFPADTYYLKLNAQDRSISTRLTVIK